MVERSKCYRALWHGSYSGVDIHYVTMSTTGNSSDFEDQLVASNTLQSFFRKRIMSTLRVNSINKHIGWCIDLLTS